MSDTDMPGRKWGAIDYSALTSRMPVRITTAFTADDLPRPLPGFRAELMDQQFDSCIVTEMQQVINQQAARVREEIGALQVVASALGDPRGIEIGHELVEAGDDTIRYRTRIRLSEAVPAGEVHYRAWGF